MTKTLSKELLDKLAHFAQKTRNPKASSQIHSEWRSVIGEAGKTLGIPIQHGVESWNRVIDELDSTHPNWRGYQVQENRDIFQKDNKEHQKKALHEVTEIQKTIIQKILQGKNKPSLFAENSSRKSKNRAASVARRLTNRGILSYDFNTKEYAVTMEYLAAVYHAASKE